LPEKINGFCLLIRCKFLKELFMTDPFKEHEAALTSPARNAFVVTPDDAIDLPITCRSLFVGGAGDVSAILAKEISAVIFKNVPAGAVLPVSVKRVEATLTTATDIVGLY
jgi:hypothetical protein